MATKKASRRVGKSFKDLVVIFLANGVSGVQQATVGDISARGKIVKAIEHLEKIGHGSSAGALRLLAATGYPAGHRGRPTPRVGTERTYKAQATEKIAAFLRVPTASLGVKKGGEARVRFEADRIIILKA